MSAACLVFLHKGPPTSLTAIEWHNYKFCPLPPPRQELASESAVWRDLEPVVSDLLHRHELRFPVIHLLLKRLHKRRALHRLRLDDVVFEYQLNVVDRRQYRHALSHDSSYSLYRYAHWYTSSQNQRNMICILPICSADKVLNLLIYGSLRFEKIQYVGEHVK